MNLFNVITLFPNLIDEWKNTGIIFQAIKNNIIEINSVNLRDYGIGSYKQVDDAPYGGGPGMVLMPEPLDNAINSTNVNINVFLLPTNFAEFPSISIIGSNSLQLVVESIVK